MPTACSSDGYLMNVGERPPPCECTTKECDGLTCGSVVSTPAQDHNMTNHHIAEHVPGDCITTQEAPKAHHSNISSGLGHGCLLSGQHPDHDQPIANNGRYEYRVAQDARAEGIGPQQTVEVSSHKITETLNVQVNDGSNIGS